MLFHNYVNISNQMYEKGSRPFSYRHYVVYGGRLLLPMLCRLICLEGNNRFRATLVQAELVGSGTISITDSAHLI